MLKKIGLIFGGVGNESGVSIDSAKNIAKNFNIPKYELIFIKWSKDCKFYKLDNILDKTVSSKNISIGNLKKYIDIALPITHGRYGEDGILQSLLELAQIKYCGCRILTSALCMDKIFFKDYVAKHQIPQVDYASLNYKTDTKELIDYKIDEVIKNFHVPIFVKPANSGSSIRITKVKDLQKLRDAIRQALKYDFKIIIEQGINNPREIEVAVIGNNSLLISSPGELVPANEFYDFDDKYKLNKTSFLIPADLTENQLDKIKRICEDSYRICDCTGFARIDLFIDNDKIYLNEINTLPGFTDNSMFPRLLKESGLSYNDIFDRIISLAY